MAKPLSFKQFTVANPSMTDDEHQAYMAQKRRRDIPTGNTGEETEQEALDITQRRARARLMKRNKAKIALGRKRAARKIANIEVIKKRLRKKVRGDMVKKLTKDIPKDELTFARRQELEKRLETPAFRRRIDMMVKKQLPKARQAEIQKKRGGGAKSGD